MTQQGTVIVPSSPLRLLKTLIVSNLLMLGGILGVSVGLVGVGTWTFIVVGVVVVLTTVLYVIAAIRGRPRVVITPEGFALEKVIGREEHRWDNVAGPFAVIKVGWSRAVAFNLTPEYKVRVGKKPTSLYGGYDAALTGALRCSPDELAELLNEHLRRSKGAPGPMPPGQQAAFGEG